MKVTLSLALAACLTFHIMARPISTTRMARSVAAPVESSQSQTGSTPTADPDMPDVRLNRLVFEDKTTINVTVKFKTARQLVAVNKTLVLGTSESKDIESVSLVAAAEPMTYQSNVEIIVRFSNGSSSGKSLDGVLSTKPGEFIMALYAYSPNGNLADAKSGRLAADFGIVADDSDHSASVIVEPKFDVDAKLGVGTLASSHGIVQVALDELLFHPNRPEQLSEFLKRTQGTVVRSSPSGQQKEPSWYAIRIKPQPTASKYISQLRSLVGDQGVIGVGNQRTFDLYAYTSELSLDGYRVALHPRLNFSSDLRAVEGGPGLGIDAMSVSGLSSGMSSALFGIRESWALLAMFDYDRREPVKAAFLDVGFAPNPDFRGFPTLIERDMTDHGRLGPGAATGVPTVGASFFGARIWHGNGVVTIAGGALNNRFGAAGTGGQVLSPMLYKYGLVAYLLDIDEGIRTAVGDGAELINISAGYPCRLLWTLGPDNICSIDGRELFAVKLSAVFFGIATVICATLGWIPFVGGAICGAALVAAAAATAAVLIIFPFLGNLRGAMEEAVDFATQRGVPIISSAGNRIRPDSLGVFAEFVDVDNSNADDWQVIPGVIPHVINCGAASPTGPFANQEFYGNAVDIWAPVASSYWAPPTLDSVATPASQVQYSLSGTSAAAPYVTGILSNMMAANLSLRRGTAMHDDIPNIVQNLTNLLLLTATIPGTGVRGETLPMPADVRATDVLEVSRRRNMVNAFDAIRRAAGTEILNYESLGYDSDLGLVSDAGPGDDGADRQDMARDFHGHTLGSTDFTMESHGLVEEEFKDELGYIQSSPPLGSTFTDQDWYLWKTPPVPGVYVSTVTLTIPSVEATGSILVNGAPGTLTSDTGVEKTFTFETPQLFEDAVYRFRVHGVGNADSLYKLRIGRAGVSPTAPSADPYEGGSGDDVIGNATRPGDWSEVRREDPTGIHEARAFEVVSSGHTIHARDDADWFRIEAPPLVPENCDGCPPTLRIYLDPPSGLASIELHAADGSLIRSQPADRPLTLSCYEYRDRFPLFIRVVPLRPSPLSYTIRARWSIPSEDFCRTIARILEALGDPAIAGRGRGHRPDAPTQPLHILGGTRYFDPYEYIGEAGRPQPADRNERTPSPSLYLVNWDGGDFMMRVLGGSGQSLRLALYTPEGKLLTQGGTPDVFKQINNQNVGSGMAAADLTIRGLKAGQYIVSFSQMQPRDRVMVFLPQAAIHDGTFGFESFLKPSKAKAWRLGSD